jgi:alcohol dehydrogenase (cytochrome c)
MMVPAGGFSFMAFSPYTAQKTVSLPNPLDHFTPVTAVDLANPPPQDWLTWRRGWNANGFSPLTQISLANASSLRMVWSWALAGGIDRRRASRSRRYDLHAGLRRRGAGVERGHRGSALAVQPHARTWGRAVSQAWDGARRRAALFRYVGCARRRGERAHRHGGVGHEDRQHKAREQLNGGPLFADGKVLVGTAGTGVGAKPGGPQIVGLDALTGQEIWRLGTIAKPGEPSVRESEHRCAGDAAQ